MTTLDWLPYLKLSTSLDDAAYLKTAYQGALSSKDPSTQLGALLICQPYSRINSCNCFPAGVKEYPERLYDRDVKIKIIEHAERNAIFTAAKMGIQTKGANLYCPWYACTDCARAIIQAGITRVCGHLEMFQRTPDRWRESIQLAFTLFEEAGVVCEAYSGKLSIEPVRFNGELWFP